MALILVRDDTTADTVSILDFVASVPLFLDRNTAYRFTGSVVDLVIQQEMALTVSEDDARHPFDEVLFVKPGLSCGLLVPLRLDGRVMGVLIFGSGQKGQLDSYRGKAVQLSQILPLAIEKNRLVSPWTSGREMKIDQADREHARRIHLEMDEVLRKHDGNDTGR
jgi:transcriptional regulator with GAF, ATPase, and Fis domain